MTVLSSVLVKINRYQAKRLSGHEAKRLSGYEDDGGGLFHAISFVYMQFFRWQGGWKGKEG